MSIRDELSSSPTNDRRLRTKPQEATATENRFAPLRGNSSDDVAREWTDHPGSVKDEDEKPSALDKNSDQESDDEQGTVESENEASNPQKDRIRGEPQACLFVAR